MSTQIACRQLLELISGYLDEALPDDTRAAVEAHLTGCDGCSAVLDEFRTTIELTGQLTEAQLTPAQRDTMLAAFRGWTGS